MAPITYYEKNPHYLFYKGRPRILLTSDQHYGAVINSDFDYARFLDKLKSKEQNFTRIYPGAYIEKEDEFVKGNPLGPAPTSGTPWGQTLNTIDCLSSDSSALNVRPMYIRRYRRIRVISFRTAAP